MRTKDLGSLAFVVLLSLAFVFALTDVIVGYCQNKYEGRFGVVQDKVIHTDEDGDKSYTLYADVAGEYQSHISVSRGDFNSVNVGDHIKVSAVIGGITGWHYRDGFMRKVRPEDIPQEQ